MCNDKLKLLVVEDRNEHFADFEKILTEQEFPIALDITRAKTLKEALPLIPQADGVVSDLFFPTQAGGAEEPCGRNVVEECLKIGKPVIWITSTWHHGSKTNKHNNWGRDKNLEMFDSGDMQNPETETEHKPWLEAILGIIYSIYAAQFKEWTFTSDGVKTSKHCAWVWRADKAVNKLMSGAKLSDNHLAYNHMIKLGFDKFAKKVNINNTLVIKSHQPHNRTQPRLRFLF